MRETSLSWQKILAQGFSSSKELLNFLELPDSFASTVAETQFSSRIPLSYAMRMQKGNPKDPLLLQVLAAPEELNFHPEYSNDPLEESNSNPLKGLIHKYHGRVLLTLTGVCAVNCRYCFRRHFPYQQNNPGKEGLRAILEYIENDNNIHEVILSGGDPLLASDHTLSFLLEALNQIPHVKTLRIHTRIPIVFPERIDNPFLKVLSTTSLQKVLVVHCNHAQELADKSVVQALRDLKSIGCFLFNQSVLLAGVNDSVDTLASLSHALFENQIVPYYLHVLDKVQGAAHFDIPWEQAQTLYQQLQHLLPGYLVPKLVCEIPGKYSKTLMY